MKNQINSPNQEKNDFVNQQGIKKEKHYFPQDPFHPPIKGKFNKTGLKNPATDNTLYTKKVNKKTADQNTAFEKKMADANGNRINFGLGATQITDFSEDHGE